MNALRNALVFLLVGIVLGVGGVLGYQWYTALGIAVEATTAPQIAKEEKQEVACTSVQVYKPKVKRKVKLPKEVRQDPTIHLVDVTRIPADIHDTTVSAVYNSVDGNIKMYTYPEPLPLIGLKRRLTLGAGYSVDEDARTGWAAYGFYEVAQVKALQIKLGGLVTEHQRGVGLAAIEYSF